MDLTPGPYEDRLSLANVLHEADCGWNCHGHGILGPGRDALYERMATAALDKLKIGDIREAAYRAGREVTARDIAQAIESAAAADRTPRLVGHDAVLLWDGRQFAYDHSAALARAARVSDCGDEFHGADGGPCQGCGFDLADQVDQPRTPSGCDGEDSPEERTDG